MGELAKRLGYGDRFPQSEEALLEHVLKDSEFTPGDVRADGGSVMIPTGMMEYKKWEKGLLRKDGKPGFDTPSGKLEIASSVLGEHGYDPLPVYTEPKEGPLSSPNPNYPLVFSSGARVKTDFCSQHHGIKGLLNKAPGPIVTINSKDAKKRGIKNGAEVDVITLRGRARFRARVTNDIVEGAIDANMGGGGPVGPDAWKNCNVNTLTDLELHDPISGFPVYKSLLCEVEFVSSNVAHSVDEIFDDQAGEMSTLKESAKKPSQPVIYMDNNATTSLNPEALDVMLPYLRQEFGNPSSIHTLGVEAKEALSNARRSIAQVINATAKRIVFTSGGSEADNLAIKGVAKTFGTQRGHIITSTIEHPAILKTCQILEQDGYTVTYLPVDKSGTVDPKDLKKAIGPETILVSIMMANNETGVIQPISELAAIAKEYGVLFHSDGVQALGKIPIDVDALGVDLLSLSSHKIHGPKGAGALFVRSGVNLSALIDGGDQENSLRAGTENIAAIVGFAKAAEIAAGQLPAMVNVAKLRDKLQAGIAAVAENSFCNGQQIERLPNTVNMTIPGFRGESLVLKLDRENIALSSGSACKSGSPNPSPALLAMGLTDEEAHCSIRFSLDLKNTATEVDTVLRALEKIISESRSTIRFMPCR